MKELKIDDVKVEKEKKGQEESTASEKAAEKLKQAARELYKEHSDIEILRAELKDARHDLDSAYREIKDLHKTISKMQQHREAEVQDLKNQLGEAKAAEAAAKKAHAHAVGEKNNYADALDNDSVAFEEILGLAIILERSAKSMQEMSKMLQEKTEGKV